MIEDRTTPCPSDEVLAQFVEGNLARRQQRAVERHVADCSECIVVVSAASALLETSSGQTPAAAQWRWPWLAAAAATLIALLMPLAVREFIEWRDPLATLRRVAARQEARPFEGRLAGFAHIPFARIRSGAESSTSLAIRVEAERLDAEHAAGAGMLHARGVAALLIGNRRQAVRLLTEAANAAPKDANLWNDYAVALDAAAPAGDDSARVEALHAADRATALARTSAAAHFTRAVVLEHLRRLSGAAAEYRRATMLDRDPAWRQEALSRISALRE